MQQQLQAVLDASLQRWGQSPESLLQILIDLQHNLHHIPPEAIDQLSDRLGLSHGQIRGVIGFYSFLHDSPRGQYEILVSDNISDRYQGSHELAASLSRALGVALGETSTDGLASLDFTSCIGMSDQGPAMLVNGQTLPRMDSARLAQVIELIKARKPLNEWPEALFVVEDNIRRADLLLNTALVPGSALAAAERLGAEAMLSQLEASGLRGRGGAGFKTATKWRFCRQAAGERVVICNADEGEPGTFKDRILLASHAPALIEGMALCAKVIDASGGFIYLRGEYRHLLEPLNQALANARSAGILGQGFDISIHLGAGAYICGEESALIESLEGKRGVPRNRPPFPVTSGYLGRPTVVNNVETFIAAAHVAVQGAEWLLAKGTSQSSGTKVLSVSGDCARPGIYEYPWGVSIRQILDDCGAKDVQAVQVAGPAGRLIPPAQFGRTLAFEDLGTGGSFMVFGQGRDLLEVVGNFNDFFCHESCGFCTPCRVGNPLLQLHLGKLRQGQATKIDLELMQRIGRLMQQDSHCGLGTTAANPVLDLINDFPGHVQQQLLQADYAPDFDLNAALEEARRLGASQGKSAQGVAP